MHRFFLIIIPYSTLIPVMRFDNKIISIVITCGFLGGISGGGIVWFCANPKNVNYPPAEILNTDLKTTWSLAQKNDIQALEKLADAYSEGEIIEQNIPRALSYLKKASDLGSAKSAYEVASAYHSGKGIKTNLEKAERYYRIAAEKGHAEALYQLGSNASGLIDKKDPFALDLGSFNIEKKDAIELLIQAANQNHAGAEYKLATIYDGDKNYTKAIHYYEKAINHGSSCKYLLDGLKKRMLKEKMDKAIRLTNPSTEIIDEYEYEGIIKCEYEWKAILNNTSDRTWKGKVTIKFLDINGQIIEESTKRDITLLSGSSVAIRKTSYVDKKIFNSRKKIVFECEYQEN